MGGPPAHELYRDLVIHAGLRLLRDPDGAPCVELQDGEHRRAFPVPSLELRAALDRFRMRRNLRPVPEDDIQEFARVVEARASDPDIEIPENISETSPAPPGGPPLRPAAPTSEASAGWAVDELDELMHEVDAIQGRAPDPVPEEPTEPGPRELSAHPTLRSRLPHRWHTGVSGGQRAVMVEDPRLPRYVRALRELVRDGAWIGSLSEISRRTGDDTEEVFATLLRFHTDLVGNDLVVAPVEVEDGWKWVVVDRGRTRSAHEDPAS
ncbi:MAG: hypothetical protein WB947_02205 [Thermoplasmata archaeon]